MRRRTSAVLALAALCAAGLALAGPASAITNGGPDGSAHPYVGGLVADHGRAPTGPGSTAPAR